MMTTNKKYRFYIYYPNFPSIRSWTTSAYYSSKEDVMKVLGDINGFIPHEIAKDRKAKKIGFLSIEDSNEF